MSKKIKILILEHDLNDIDMIENELKLNTIDYISKVVRTEHDYIDALNEYVPNIILSDFSIPSFNGLTAFKLREHLLPAAPFIFVSGTIGEETSIELMKNGVTDFVQKDKIFTLNTKLLRALKDAQALEEKNKTERALVLSEARLAEAQ
ncbi:MAG TPA: response regulator, partial [Ferruginibacter sp.]|nr:response regulator [Ferruginibacter sp.]